MDEAFNILEGGGVFILNDARHAFEKGAERYSGASSKGAKESSSPVNSDDVRKARVLILR